jgi:hypothetical protein
MTRLMLALAAWMGLVAVAAASLTPRKDFPPPGREAPPAQAGRLSAEVLRQVAGLRPNLEFQLTPQTEVLLDGKPCPFSAVPADARIVSLEVAADKKTVLKVHFRSGR